MQAFITFSIFTMIIKGYFGIEPTEFFIPASDAVNESVIDSVMDEEAKVFLEFEGKVNEPSKDLFSSFVIQIGVVSESDEDLD